MVMENILTISMIPFFLVLVLVELFYLKKQKKGEVYRLNDAITNLNLGIGHLLTQLFIGFILMGSFMYFYKIAPIKLPNNIWTGIAVFVLYDFCFYWAHRWGHEVNFFWAAHSVHHQSEDYNLTVALRQSWLHSLMAFVIFLPIPFMGFSDVVFFPAASINTVYQFWIHTETIHKMPRWFEYIFNTPAHHRVHHGVNPEYIDRNHAGVFIIWDRIFGTFAEEKKHPTYGITKPINTWNPVWTNFIYFSEMLEMSKMMQPMDKIRLWFKKPGWRPEYLGGPIPVPEVDESIRVKFDIEPTSKGLNTYVLAQFSLIIFGLVGYLYYFHQLSLFQQLLGFTAMLLSTVICGAILEQKSWVKYAEYLRIALVLVALNSIYYISFKEWFNFTMIVSLFLAVYFIVWYTLNSWYNIEFMQWLEPKIRRK